MHWIRILQTAGPKQEIGCFGIGSRESLICGGIQITVIYFFVSTGDAHLMSASRSACTYTLESTLAKAAVVL